MAQAPRLTVEALGKSFPTPARGVEVEVLDGVDLEVGSGEFISIVGPSGCGKSTLFNIIAGLDPPSTGHVYLDGLRDSELLGRVGYMPQQDLLMPWRTVLDNTALGLVLAGVSRAEARERARAQFAAFGLEGFEEVWPGQLSSGMRQRAALLRTFLTGNELLLLDEPFGALDALTRRDMQQWLIGVWQERKASVLFVTHDVEEALFLSDRIYVMSPRPGRVEMVLDVTLPRPRTLDAVILDPAFIELKGRLYGALHSGRGPGDLAE